MSEIETDPEAILKVSWRYQKMFAVIAQWLQSYTQSYERMRSKAVPHWLLPRFRSAKTKIRSGRL